MRIFFAGKISFLFEKKGRSNILISFRTGTGSVPETESLKAETDPENPCRMQFLFIGR